MSNLKMMWVLSMVGGALLIRTPETYAANSITNSSAAQTWNVPVLGPNQATIASYYGAGAGDNYVTSSANFTASAGGHTDPTFGLDTYAGSNFVYPSDPHGNPYYTGQSFSTGGTSYKLNSIGYGLGDGGADLSSSTEILRLFKLNNDGTVSAVGNYSATGAPVDTASGQFNTQFNIDASVAPTLAANSTYVWTLTVNSVANVSLLIPAAMANSPFGNPGGTTGQQLVSVSDVLNGNGSENVLTYSGFTSRNNSSNGVNTTQVDPQTDTQYFANNSSTPIGSTIGIFNGPSSLGIDQYDFYAIGTAVTPEPTSLGILGLMGFELLARRRREELE